MTLSLLGGRDRNERNTLEREGKCRDVRESESERHQSKKEKNILLYM